MQVFVLFTELEYEKFMCRIILVKCREHVIYTYFCDCIHDTQTCGAGHVPKLSGLSRTASWWVLLQLLDGEKEEDVKTLYLGNWETLTCLQPIKVQTRLSRDHRPTKPVIRSLKACFEFELILRCELSTYQPTR